MGPGWVEVPADCTTTEDQLRFWIDVAMVFHDQASARPSDRGRSRRRARTTQAR